MKKLNSTLKIFRGIFIAVCAVFFFGVSSVEAATLRLSPETGVYTVGNTFTANVLINTGGKPINAADAELSFNPKELTVVSVGKGGSIFNLWTLEPKFSNSAGTISFGGGSPSGYTGSGGVIMSVTFRSVAAGTPKVNFRSGSILAADGMGTNVLTSMNGGTYTIGAKTEAPAPEYIAPANTPDAPRVVSSTHPKESAWYKEKTARLSWEVPSDVTAVRTLLDTSESTVPTKVYDTPIRDRELTDLSEGTSYFHIQFKNEDGWGRVKHFALNVDSEAPDSFIIKEKEGDDITNPNKTLLFEIKDTSPILTYGIQIDGGEISEFKDTDQTKTYTLPSLPPGHHTIVVEAYDSAGNSRVATYSFDVVSFEAPVFTDYPLRMTSGVIPALKGETRPKAQVAVTVKKGDEMIGTFTSTSDDMGRFVFIPDSAFRVGVYDVTAIATDEYGAQSAESLPIRIIVEEPGYIAIGSFIVSVLSVLVPLIALILLLIFGTWYLYHKLSKWRQKVQKETEEAEDKLRSEFDLILGNFHAHVAELKESRKTKLTRAEMALIDGIEADLKGAQSRIEKEIVDIEDIVQ